MSLLCELVPDTRSRAFLGERRSEGGRRSDVRARVVVLGLLFRDHGVVRVEIREYRRILLRLGFGREREVVGEDWSDLEIVIYELVVKMTLGGWRELLGALSQMNFLNGGLLSKC